jgi:ribosomal protein S18 acetylase RimI-like enzyme
LSPVVEVVRTYLELRSPEQLRPARFDDPAVRVVRHATIETAHYRRLYDTVGGPWHWTDRLAWSDERLAAHLSRDAISVFECLSRGESAGFFELETHPDGDVEIAYFGLAVPFIGRGLGKALLTRAVEEAFALGANRVWLHTCTLDSPRALPNYQARGFTPFNRETYVTQLPS